jgi:hypothetical protein
VTDDEYGGGLFGLDSFDEALLADEKFGMFGTEGFSDEGLFCYLLVKVETAYSKVRGLGMSALITGETVELTEVGECRLVFLGTGHPGQFVREIQYAISGMGDIYEYDPIDDLWYLV